MERALARASYFVMQLRWADFEGFQAPRPGEMLKTGELP